VIIIASTDHFSEDIMDNHNIKLRLSTIDEKSNEYTIVSKIIIIIIIIITIIE
jgi:hypothetical protein